MTDENEISLEWQRSHKSSRRKHLRLYYYRKRMLINLKYSKSKGPEMDLADLAYAKFVEEWNPF